MKRILVINPGSTSTKLAVFEDDKRVWEGGMRHPVEELKDFQHVNEQYDYRNKAVRSLLAQAHIPLKFDAVIGRGGLLKPTPGGVYAVDELMKHDLLNATLEHVCNLGALIADDIAASAHCPAYIADPEVVDELMDEARLTGIPEIARLVGVSRAQQQGRVAPLCGLGRQTLRGAESDRGASWRRNLGGGSPSRPGGRCQQRVNGDGRLLLSVPALFRPISWPSCVSAASTPCARSRRC